MKITSLTFRNLGFYIKCCLILNKAGKKMKINFFFWEFNYIFCKCNYEENIFLPFFIFNLCMLSCNRVGYPPVLPHLMILLIRMCNGHCLFLVYNKVIPAPLMHALQIIAHIEMSVSCCSQLRDTCLIYRL